VQNNSQALLLFFIGTGITMSLVGFIVYSILLYRRAKVTHLKEMEHLQNEHEKAVLATTLEIREESIQAVAREVHDNIGQVLSLASLHLSNLKTKYDNPESLTVVSELLNKGIVDLRQILNILDGSSFEKYSLSELLSSQITMINRIEGQNAELRIHGTEWILAESAKTILFRVLQESLTNAVKYANANNITVKMEYETEGLRISIVDNGIGISEQTLKVGRGLKNMEYRAKLLGANFNIESKTNLGTSITINYPLSS